MNNFPAMTEERRQQLLEWIKPRLSELETLCDDMPFGLDEDDQIFMEVLQTARKMLSGQSLSTDGWIKCSERMPELDTKVLLLFTQYDNHIEDGFIGDEGDDVGWYHYLYDGDALQSNPTHWMPLPAPPEASNEQ